MSPAERLNRCDTLERMSEPSSGHQRPRPQFDGLPTIGPDGRVIDSPPAADKQKPRSSAPLIKPAEEQQKSAHETAQQAPRENEEKSAQSAARRPAIVSAAQAAQRGKSTAQAGSGQSKHAAAAGKHDKGSNSARLDAESAQANPAAGKPSDSTAGTPPQQAAQAGAVASVPPAPAVPPQAAAAPTAPEDEESQVYADEYEGVDDLISPSETASVDDERMALGSDRVSPADDSAATARHFKHDRSRRKPNIEIRIGHDELELRQRYEIISIVNDLLMGVWIAIAAILMLAGNTKVASVFFLIGALQMLVRAGIRLARRVHLQKISPLMTGSSAPTESSLDF